MKENTRSGRRTLDRSERKVGTLWKSVSSSVHKNGSVITVIDHPSCFRGHHRVWGENYTAELVDGMVVFARRMFNSRTLQIFVWL